MGLWESLPVVECFPDPFPPSDELETLTSSCDVFFPGKTNADMRFIFSD
jgi:hypothetical protein